MTTSAAHDLLVPLTAVEAFLAERGWAWQQLERGELRLGGDVLTVEAIESYLLLTDPVYWCEAFLVNRPEDGGGTWRLFDYQKPSMRWRGDVVHEDAAEVGKTREIIGLLLWGSVCAEGGQLVAGFEDGNLDEIWDEVEWQLGANPWLRSQLKDTWQKPYRKQEWKNGNRNVFRPAGHDGRAFRGIHVAGRAFFDEVAKVENPVTLSEFFRALKPFAEARLYSVPDGRRGSPFYQLCERAVPHQAAAASRRSSRIAAASGATAGGEQRRRFTRFNWPKTLMPPPFWSAAREQEALERYGGRDSAGFVRNVLGGWGDPEDTVFPWAKFSPCVRYVDEYRVTKLLWDHATSMVYVDAYELSPAYEVRAGSDVADDDDNRGPAPMREVYREAFQVGNFQLEALLRLLFAPPPAGTHQVGGIDVGQSQDPTEIGLSRLVGERQRFSVRVQLKHFGYDQQGAAIRTLDAILSPDHGWGLDAGGVGKAVEDSLRGGPGGYHFSDRLTGFVFNSKTEEIDPATGDPVVDPATRNARRITYKELATQLLERSMQRGQLEVPWDPDYIRDFPSHTARKLASGERAFSGHNDHAIDGKRVEVLRLYELEHGASMMPPLSYAVPANSRRDSAALRGDF